MPTNTLAIREMKNRAEIDACLDTGLNRLYQDVFRDPPYFEKFTKEEVDDIFREFLDKRGRVFVAFDGENPVGFVASLPLKENFNIAACVDDVLYPSKTGYFAEDGVAADYRRSGISAIMKKKMIVANGEDNFEKVLLRTSVYNYRQISAVNKAGGTVIGGISQDVPRARFDGVTTIDRNAFYLFETADAKKKPVPEKFDSVTICRKNGEDTAYVSDFTPWLDRPELAGWIKETYPGVRKVRFGAKIDRMMDGIRSIFNLDVKNRGEEVFNGRLYLSPKNKPFVSGAGRAF